MSEEKSSGQDTVVNEKEPRTEAKPLVDKLYRTRQLGVWTLYYPIAGSWNDSIPSFGLFSAARRYLRCLPIIRRFLLETVALGPLLFALLFVFELISSIIPSIHTRNNARILSLAERGLVDRTFHVSARKEFHQAAIVFVMSVVVGSGAKVATKNITLIMQQRISLHFKKHLLSVAGRLDLAMSENPEIQSKLERVSSRGQDPWRVFEGVITAMSFSLRFLGQLSALRSVVKSHEDAVIFGLLCIIQPVVARLAYMGQQSVFYAMVTDPYWLRMKALYKLGTTSKFKKEVLSGGLNSFIDSQYASDLKNLGDVSTESVHVQQRRMSVFGFSNINDVCNAIPLFLFAWGSINNSSSNLSLSGLVMIQQLANTFFSMLFDIMYEGQAIWTMLDKVVALYEVLALEPSIKDGDVPYPEDGRTGGAAIEFRNVNFTYPSADKSVLKDMSFAIGSGQLCVIVGENGCGKSTTINLITRMYDCTSGIVLIDGRPIGDYKTADLRAATNVMYQDYHHLPLTVRENIILGNPESSDPEGDVEEAAKLGGAYDFIQKLQAKFNANLEPERTGFSNHSAGESVDEKFTTLIDSQKPVQLSGGQWQRLALSRSFMRNSGNIKLLCYDEPSASLDPKAESEIFERLRRLRGQRTMIFVTHRFGHLTRHADLILYVKDGSVVEKGTHKELLARSGEYATMYNIQSQAFSD